MSVRPMLGMWVVAAITSVMLTPASADHWRGGREGGEWKDEYRDGPCKVKIESKDDEYKEEIKCPNGRGASWRRGEWNCSGLMKPDTHLGENARQIEVSDD
ncbi:hypothetical protein FQ185_07925 [Pseudomonas sp. ANT_H12B]|nr:hypothetical protein FQ185_07925 [Pseudomonas sp. ANT_H12B]